MLGDDMKEKGQYFDDNYEDIRGHRWRNAEIGALDDTIGEIWDALTNRWGN